MLLFEPQNLYTLALLVIEQHAEAVIREVCNALFKYCQSWCSRTSIYFAPDRA